MRPLSTAIADPIPQARTHFAPNRSELTSADLRKQGCTELSLWMELAGSAGARGDDAALLLLRDAAASLSGNGEQPQSWLAQLLHAACPDVDQRARVFAGLLRTDEGRGIDLGANVAVLLRLPPRTRLPALCAIMQRPVAAQSTADDRNGLRNLLDGFDDWPELIEMATAGQESPGPSLLALADTCKTLGLGTIAAWSALFSRALKTDNPGQVLPALAKAAAEGTKRFTSDHEQDDLAWPALLQTIEALRKLESEGGSAISLLRMCGRTPPPATVARNVMELGLAALPLVHAAHVGSFITDLVFAFRSDRRTSAEDWIWLGKATLEAGGSSVFPYFLGEAAAARVQHESFWKFALACDVPLQWTADAIGKARCASPAIWDALLDRCVELAHRDADNPMDNEDRFRSACKAMKGLPHPHILRRACKIAQQFIDMKCRPAYVLPMLGHCLAASSVALEDEGKACLDQLFALSGLSSEVMDRLAGTFKADMLLHILPPLCKESPLESPLSNDEKSMYRRIMGLIDAKSTHLNEIESVRQHRESVRARAATLNWKAVEPDALPARTFSTFAPFSDAVAAVGSALAELLTAMKPTLESKKLTRQNDAADRLKALFEPTDGALPGKNLLSASGRLRKNISDDMSRLLDNIKRMDALADFRPLAAQLEECWQALVATCESPDFKEAAKTYQVFRTRVLDKDALSTFMAGEAVGCCMAPDGTHFNDMLNRLISPDWILVGVTDAQGEVVAVAWTALCRSNQDKRTFLVVDFCDAKPRYTQHEKIGENREIPNRVGNRITGELLAYTARVGTALGVDEIWVAQPTYFSRLRDFPEFDPSRFTYQLDLDDGLLHPPLFRDGHYSDRVCDPAAKYRPGNTN